jgi:hypothetical protein
MVYLYVSQREVASVPSPLDSLPGIERLYPFHDAPLDLWGDLKEARTPAPAAGW